MAIQTLQMYLTCTDLAGHPQAFSAWMHMRQIGNNQAFIMVMGIDVWTFEALLVPFSSVWDSSTITQLDFNPYSKPQPHQSSLDPAGRLSLVLHWLSSTMAAYTLQQIFAIMAAVCAQNLQFGQAYLLQVLRDLKISRIAWPSCKLLEFCVFPLHSHLFFSLTNLSLIQSQALFLLKQLD